MPVAGDERDARAPEPPQLGRRDLAVRCTCAVGRQRVVWLAQLRRRRAHQRGRQLERVGARLRFGRGRHRERAPACDVDRGVARALVPAGFAVAKLHRPAGLEHRCRPPGCSSRVAAAAALCVRRRRPAPPDPQDAVVGAFQVVLRDVVERAHPVLVVPVGGDVRDARAPEPLQLGRCLGAVFVPRSLGGQAVVWLVPRRCGVPGRVGVRVGVGVGGCVGVSVWTVTVRTACGGGGTACVVRVVRASPVAHAVDRASPAAPRVVVHNRVGLHRA